MTNGSYELNGKSNVGYVEDECINLPGAFNVNDPNGNGIEASSDNGKWEILIK